MWNRSCQSSWKTKAALRTEPVHILSLGVNACWSELFDRPDTVNSEDRTEPGLKVLRWNGWRRTTEYCKSKQQYIERDSEKDGCQGGIPHETRLEEDLDDNANTTSCKLRRPRQWQVDRCWDGLNGRMIEELQAGSACDCMKNNSWKDERLHCAVQT